MTVAYKWASVSRRIVLSRTDAFPMSGKLSQPALLMSEAFDQALGRRSNDMSMDDAVRYALESKRNRVRERHRAWPSHEP